MSSLELSYLSGVDIDALALTDDEIVGHVRAVPAAQGRARPRDIGHRPWAARCCSVRRR